MVHVEQRMFTDAEQIAAVTPNETGDGLILKTSELDDTTGTTVRTRLYLTLEEAEELSSMLISLVSKLHGLKVKSK